MPERRVLTGWVIHVVDMPAIPGVANKAGRAIILEDIAEPHNSIVYAMDESLSKDIGHKLVGQGKVRTATPEEMAQMSSLISQG
jgi:hypothetical protein